MGVQTLEHAAPAQGAITIDATPASAWLTRSRTAAPYVLIALVAVLSRLRYAAWAYHDNFGSGDAQPAAFPWWVARQRTPFVCGPPIAPLPHGT